MIGPSILDRYVFREVLTSFLFSFGIFMFAGLVAGFLPLLERGIAKGLSLTIILFQMLIYALPNTLVTVLPLSLTIGILMGLGRMSADNEIAAIKSSGISVARLLPAVLFIGIIGTFLSLYCTLILIPQGIAKGNQYLRDAAATRVDVALDERVFFDQIPGLMVYTDSIDPITQEMSNVFIRDSTDPKQVRTILARKARVIPDTKKKNLIFELRDFTTLVSNEEGDFDFGGTQEKWIVAYSLWKKNQEHTIPHLEELAVAKILERLKKYQPKAGDNDPKRQHEYDRQLFMAKILLTQRFVNPLACVALAMFAFPIGVMEMGKSRLNNVSLGLIAIFIYYAFALAVERIARSKLAMPELVLPLPALTFMITGAYLTRCVRLERIPLPLRILKTAIQSIRPK